MYTGAYSYVQNATNLAISKINRAGDLEHAKHSAKQIASNMIKKETRQVSNSSVTQSDRDTSKVTSTTTRAVVPVASGVHSELAAKRAAENYEKSMLKHDIKLTEMIDNGTYSRIESSASSMGITLNSNFQTRVDGAGVQLKTLNYSVGAEQQAEALRVYNLVAQDKIHKLQQDLKTASEDTAKGIRNQIDDLKKLNETVSKNRDSLLKIGKLRERASTLPMRGLKKFTRPVNLLAMPLRSSEVYRGYEMARASAVPVMYLSKKVGQASFNTAANSIVHLRWNAQAKELAKTLGVSKKAAMKQILETTKLKTTGIRGLFKKNPMTVAFRQHLRQQIRIRRAARFEAKALKAGANSLRGLRFAAKSNIEIAKAELEAGRISKDAFKTALKEQKAMLRSGNPIGRAINKRRAVKDRARAVMAHSLRNTWTAFGRTKLGKPIVDAFSALGRMLGFLKRIIDGIMTAIHAVLMAVLGFVLIVVLIALLLGAISAVCHKLDNIGITQSHYATTDAAKWDTYSKKIFKMLTDKHDAYINTISGVAEKYPAADIQYPNGANENYREIFAAIEIMTQYSPAEALSYDDLKEIASDLYDRTHTVSKDTYSYKSNGGVEHENDAAHIYITILRGETILAEAFDHSDFTTSSLKNADGVLCSLPVEAAPEDWLATVKGVKQAVASTGCVYDQSNSIVVTLNGASARMRTDCSGYVSACLAFYNGSNSLSVVDGAIVDNSTSETTTGWATGNMLGINIDGFQTFRFSNLDSCAAGDIMVKNGHTEIFDAKSNGQYYVYNCGATDAMQNPGQTIVSYKAYEWVYRPNSAGGGNATISSGSTNDGSSTDSTSDNIPSATTNTNVPSGTTNTNVSSGSASDNESAVGTSTWDPSTYKPVFSNMTGVTFDEESGNEIGYDVALRSSMDTIITGTFKEGSSDNKTVKTSHDWVRAVLAEHGVEFEFDEERAMFSNKTLGFSTELVTGSDDVEREAVVDSGFVAGDIMFYVPSNTETDEMQKTLGNNSFGTLDLTMLEKTVTLSTTAIDESGQEVTSEEEKTYGSILSENVVPLIYDGEGHWVSWCKDINDNEETYTDSDAEVRYYPTSDLEAKRIVHIIRKTGFTISPIYGYTTYFEGWTDYHIAEFTEIINNSCWSDGEMTIDATNGDGTITNVSGAYASDESAYTSEDSEFKSKIDYSWYHEDIFIGNSTFSSDDHIAETIKDLESLFIRNYDEWGILPSFGVSYVLAVTNNRTTEESLKFFNIFGVEKEVLDVDLVNKYSYDDGGHVSMESKSYQRFANFYKAFQAWKGSADDSLFEPQYYGPGSEIGTEILNGTAFETQFKKFSDAGLIKEGTALAPNLLQSGKFTLAVSEGMAQNALTYAQLTTGTYELYKTSVNGDVSLGLNSADLAAITRYKYMTELRNAMNDWDSYFSTSPYNGVDYNADPNEACTEEEYLNMVARAKAIKDCIDNLQTFEAQNDNEDSNGTSYNYVTSTEISLLESAINKFEDINSNVLKPAQVVGYPTCTGHSYTPTSQDIANGDTHYKIKYRQNFDKNADGSIKMVTGFGRWDFNEDTGEWTFINNLQFSRHAVPYFTVVDGKKVVDTSKSSIQYKEGYAYTRYHAVIGWTDKKSEAYDCPDKDPVWKTPPVRKYHVSDEGISDIRTKIETAKEYSSNNNRNN